jgi:hypothetical protein
METNLQQNHELEKLEPNPSGLLQLAVQQNLDIDKLEKLMQMQERWQAQQARREFLNAISHFQAICPPIEKTKRVAFGNTKYSYAQLGDIAATIKKPMSDNGLSHRWEIGEDNDNIVVTCIISHVSGHSERTTMKGGKDGSGNKNAIQSSGSTVTYLQRYSLIGALGISTADEDTDGQKPEPVVTTQPRQTAAPVPPVQPKQPTNHTPDPKAGDGKKPEGGKTMSNQTVKPWLNPNTKEWKNAFEKIHTGQITMDDVLANYRISIANSGNLLNPKYVYVPTNYEKFQKEKEAV